MSRPSADQGPRLRLEPLWIRVDRNRLKLFAFVALFVLGSAALLALAMVAVPVVAFGYVGVQNEWWTYPAVLRALGWGVGGSFLLLVIVGGVLAVAQIANAEDWVRSRFGGRDPGADEARAFRLAVEEMSLAAGFPAPPVVEVVPSSAVNAFVLGPTRKQPVVGVTTALLTRFTAEEQRAVVAALLARAVSGDILFGTALAALMGPLRSIRGLTSARRKERRGRRGPAASKTTARTAEARGNRNESREDAGDDACECCWRAADGAGGCGPFDDACGAVMAPVAFVLGVIALTYAAVWTASWIVTLWGRALHRTGHEKSDAEGMLLLKDPAPMVSALHKALGVSNDILEGDPSYDGILYTSTSGRKGLERAERLRLRRLCEVLGVEGGQAWEKARD